MPRSQRKPKFDNVVNLICMTPGCTNYTNTWLCEKCLVDKFRRFKSWRPEHPGNQQRRDFEMEQAADQKKEGRKYLS